MTRSNERTDERTERSLADVNQETAVDAGARIKEFTTIGDVIAAGRLWQSEDRHERITTDPPRPEPDAGTETVAPDGATLEEDA